MEGFGETEQTLKREPWQLQDQEGSVRPRPESDSSSPRPVCAAWAGNQDEAGSVGSSPEAPLDRASAAAAP